jgi:hypothetical protein
MAEVPNHLLEASASALAFDVSLGDIVVLEGNGVGAVSRASKVNGWVVSGDNKLEVRIWRPAKPPPGEPRFSMRLRRVLLGASTAGDTVLAQYEWSATTSPLSPAPASVFSTTVQLAAVAPWSWTRADVVAPLTPADQQAVVDLLQRLRSALASKSISDVVTLQTTQVREQATAVGNDPNETLLRYREFLQGRMADPSWSVLPLKDADVRIRTMAAGRVHHVTRPDGSPPIRCTSAEDEFAVTPFVARIGGHWTIVR